MFSIQLTSSLYTILHERFVAAIGMQNISCYLWVINVPDTCFLDTIAQLFAQQ